MSEPPPAGHDKDIEQSALPPVSRTYVSQQLPLHYVDWGNAGAPTLLLLHGRRDHCRNWDWIAREFRRDFHIIAPDLRGHGDSQWSIDGNYPIAGFIFDVAELIHQQALAPVILMGHSLGANVALRYAGIYPENVKKLVAIEGLNTAPKILVGKPSQPFPDSIKAWIEKKRDLSRRQSRRYRTLGDASRRMQEKIGHLTTEQLCHLTRYGVKQNEDGTYSWKFDPHLYGWPSSEMSQQETDQLLRRINCPTLLVHGTESWLPNPLSKGQAALIPAAEVVMIDGTHWVHHGALETVLKQLRRFLKPDLVMRLD